MKFVITLEEDEDGFIVASCPALPGCHSQGSDRTKPSPTSRRLYRRTSIESMIKCGEPAPGY